MRYTTEKERLTGSFDEFPLGPENRLEPVCKREKNNFISAKILCKRHYTYMLNYM